MFIHVTDAEYLGDYRLKISFNNGKTGVIDLNHSLEGAVFSPLKDEKLFSQLKIDKEINTIVWPNGADFAPEYLYFEAFKGVPELQDKFIKWGYIL